MEIKLRFIQESNIFARGINFWTWSVDSHVDFVFPDGYLGSRPIKGVRIRPFNYIEPAKEMFAVVDCSDEVSKKVEEFARAQVGKGYNYLGILGFIIKHDFGPRKKSWFCSELIAAAFEYADYPLLDIKEIDRLSPRDLSLSDRIKFLLP